MAAANEPSGATEPLERWSVAALLAGIGSALVGTILAVLDVDAGGLMIPAVIVLLVSAALLVAGGIMRALLPGS